MVIGTGGYVSGPVLKMAASAGVPIVLQEQNAYAGATNKLMANKAAQIHNNPQFYFVCVALLLDATETLQEMVTHLDKQNSSFKNYLSETFLERLKWVSDQFGKDYRETVGDKSLDQNEINDLLKKLGLG